MSSGLGARIIAGNWKMHGSVALVAGLAEAIKPSPGVEIIIAPPFPYLAMAKAAMNPAILIAGQDCHTEDKGAYTGEVAAPMLKELGCQYVILGHSERRQYHHEGDTLLHAKAERAIASGLIPILCIGETLEEREGGATLDVVAAQLSACLPEKGNFLIAYEPVWAIGTGKTPSDHDIAAMHTHIRRVIAPAQESRDRHVPLLYGGSVKPANAASILALSEVDGVLVGGASIAANEFAAIIAAAATEKES